MRKVEVDQQIEMNGSKAMRHFSASLQRKFVAILLLLTHLNEKATKLFVALGLPKHDHGRHIYLLDPFSFSSSGSSLFYHLELELH